MGAFYTPSAPYDLNTWLDNLGIYSLTDAAAEYLENCRQIIDTEKYYFQGVPFPPSTNSLIAALDTYSGNITVPALSYVLAITGDTYVRGVEREPGGRSLAGFQFRLYDKGAKMDTVVNSQFSYNNDFCGVMAAPALPKNATDLSGYPFGPLFPQSPMVVLEPGSLQIEITNLNDSSSVYCQILLMLAVPVNRLSANEVIVRKGSNG